MRPYAFSVIVGRYVPYIPDLFYVLQTAHYIFDFLLKNNLSLYNAENFFKKQPTNLKFIKTFPFTQKGGFGTKLIGQIVKNKNGKQNKFHSPNREDIKLNKVIGKCPRFWTSAHYFKRFLFLYCILLRLFNSLFFFYDFRS